MLTFRDKAPRTATMPMSSIGFIRRAGTVGAAEVEAWYVREVDGHAPQVWRITERAATHMGVTNPEGGAGTYYEAMPGETIWDSLRRQTPWFADCEGTGPFRRMRLAPGDYYPRISRPIALMKQPKLYLPNLDDERVFWREAQNQLTALVRQLQAICRVVDPVPMNMSVYGHEIRNLLILAATEVEMHWRGVLIANGRCQHDRFSTNDYVKLAEPLGLRRYKIHFHLYPELEPIIPFETWTATDPTKTLNWYSAYHAVKHNREHEFDSATLGNAISAVAACVGLMVAQFGEDALGGELSSVVSVDAPDWSIEDMYVARYSAYVDDWDAIRHPALC